MKLLFFPFLLLILLFTVIGSPACKHEPVFVNDPDPTDTIENPVDTTTINPTGVPCNPDTVYFQNQILPMLVAYCSKSGCHNEADHQEGVILTSYETLMSTVEGVSNNNWEDNELMEVLVLNDADERMPPAPNTKLSLAQIDLIAKWIGQGARNNGCNELVGSGCDTTGVKYTTVIKSLIQNKCQGCHSGTTPQGNLSLTTYSDVKQIAANGKLVASITRTTNWMPKNGQRLDACSVNKIKAWVKAGAPE